MIKSSNYEVYRDKNLGPWVNTQRSAYSDRKSVEKAKSENPDGRGKKK